jgi:hypothetical protein
MTQDPLLQDLNRAAARAGADEGAVVHLVADGVVWQGRLVGPAVWAAAQADTPAQDDGLRDAAAEADAYLHFATATYITGGKATRVHGVRVSVAAVSAWWTNHTDA